MTEECEDCGFRWAEIEITEIPPRLAAAGAKTAALLRLSPTLGQRVQPDRWSGVEYAAHLRDVALNLRERIIVALALDTPKPPSMFGTLRVDQGLYESEKAEALAAEIRLVERLFTRLLDAVPAPAWRRTLIYPWPVEAERTLSWVAAQTLHEWEHHTRDIEENVFTGPERLYHLSLATEWQAHLSEAQLTVSTRGRSLVDEGFIHLSFAPQLNGVIDRFYSDVRDQLVVLEVDPKLLPLNSLRCDLVTLDGEQTAFPHLYQALPRDAILSVTGHMQP